jgi:hypothetical protein
MIYNLLKVEITMDSPSLEYFLTVSRMQEHMTKPGEG